MSCCYMFDKRLATSFLMWRRKCSTLRFRGWYKDDGLSEFRGRGDSLTDIFMPYVKCESDEEICWFEESDYFDPPNMSVKRSATSNNELIVNFEFGSKREARGGVTECSRVMQTDAIRQTADNCDFTDTEYSDVVNFNHHREENMERIAPENEKGTEAKSFIPIDIGKSYLNEAAAYYKTLFGHLPNEYYAIDYADFDKTLNLKKSMENVEKFMKVKQRFVYKGTDPKNKKVKIREVNYVTDDGMLLFFSDPFNAVIAIYDKPEQLTELLPHIVSNKNKKTPEKPRFKLLVHSQYGFGTEEFDLRSFDVNVNDNYNDDLPDKKIRNFINAEGEAGLCILHGKPGTGKTYYIRDLIKNCNREFIYMNKECLNYINDSSFIAFLVRSKNSVFIMEDCENVLASRTEYNNTISTLLNLSDGLLGDSLNNKFICTFNTDISNIDEALLRKGRMKVCYEFKYLTSEKANKLAEKLHKKDRFDKEVPLCDVMNSESNGSEDIPSRGSKKIGF